MQKQLLEFQFLCTVIVVHKKLLVILLRFKAIEIFDKKLILNDREVIMAMNYLKITIVINSLLNVFLGVVKLLKYGHFCFSFLGKPINKSIKNIFEIFH